MERKEKSGREGKRRGRQRRKRARERREGDEKQDNESHHCKDWRTVGSLEFPASSSSSSDSEFDSIVKVWRVRSWNYLEITLKLALLCKRKTE